MPATLNSKPIPSGQTSPAPAPPDTVSPIPHPVPSLSHPAPKYLITTNHCGCAQAPPCLLPFLQVTTHASSREQAIKTMQVRGHRANQCLRVDRTTAAVVITEVALLSAREAPQLRSKALLHALRSPELGPGKGHKRIGTLARHNVVHTLQGAMCKGFSLEGAFKKEDSASHTGVLSRFRPNFVHTFQCALCKGVPSRHGASSSVCMHLHGVYFPSCTTCHVMSFHLIPCTCHSQAALDRFYIEGPHDNVAFLRCLISQPVSRSSSYRYPALAPSFGAPQNTVTDTCGSFYLALQWTGPPSYPILFMVPHPVMS